MQTEPTIRRICVIASGGQGIVTLVHLALRDDEAEELAAAGWIIHGLAGDRHLVCVSKRVHPPAGDERSRDHGLDMRDRQAAWYRLRREFALLQRCEGLPVPRPLRISEREGGMPWGHEFFEEYVDGLTVFDAVERGMGPNPDELVEFSHALLKAFGGEDGSTGLPGAEIAHRDVTPPQILIPRAGQKLHWDRPVVLDLGVGFHPDEPMRGHEGTIIPTTTNLPRTVGWYPPERLRPWYEQGMGREERFALDSAGDLWGWALVVGYAATGRNLWNVVRRQDDTIVASPEWGAVLRGEPIEPPVLNEIADAELREGARLALHPDPHQRDRRAIAAAMPLSIEDEVAQLDDRLANSRRTVKKLRTQVGQLQSELKAQEAPRSGGNIVSVTWTAADGESRFLLRRDRELRRAGAAMGLSSTWQPMSAPPDAAKPIAIAHGSHTPGHLEVFITDERGNIWHQWRHREGEDPDVFVVDGDGNAALEGHRADARIAGQWSEWRPFGCGASVTPAALTAYSAFEGHLEVFMAGADGQLRNRWYERDWDHWSPWYDREAPEGRVLALASGACGPLQVVVATTTSGIFVMHYDREPADGSDWQWGPWIDLSNGVGLPTGPVTMTHHPRVPPRMFLASSTGIHGYALDLTTREWGAPTRWVPPHSSTRGLAVKDRVHAPFWNFESSRSPRLDEAEADGHPDFARVSIIEAGASATRTNSSRRTRALSGR